MRKPQILYCYQYFGTPQGGWSTRVYEMARRWVDAGYEVTVLTTPYDKSDIKVAKGISTNYSIDGIQVRVLNFPQSNKHGLLRRIVQFMKFIFFSGYYVMKLDFDVIIASSGPITVGLLGIIAKKFRGKKFVFEVRDLWPGGAVQLGIIKNKILQKLAFRLEAACYAHAQLIVCCSSGMEEDINSRFSYRKTLVVPNAADIDLFSPPSAVESNKLHLKPRVIYTGSLGLMDNCMQIMYAAALLDKVKYKDVEFLIVGEGVDRPAMESFAQEHGLDFVKFTGLLPKVQVADLLRHACCSIICFKDVAILNTVSPNKLFDAFAAGVPVVQTTSGWIATLVQQHQCGSNVPPDNPQAMIHAICNYLDNEQLREMHGARARGLALHQFNRDTCAATMINAIQAVWENKDFNNRAQQTIVADSSSAA